jgi:hypothetical protein
MLSWPEEYVKEKGGSQHYCCALITCQYGHHHLSLRWPTYHAQLDLAAARLSLPRGADSRGVPPTSVSDFSRHIRKLELQPPAVRGDASSPRSDYLLHLYFPRTTTIVFALSPAYPPLLLRSWTCLPLLRPLRRVCIAVSSISFTQCHLTSLFRLSIPNLCCFAWSLSTVALLYLAPLDLLSNNLASSGLCVFAHPGPDLIAAHPLFRPGISSETFILEACSLQRRCFQNLGLRRSADAQI